MCYSDTPIVNVILFEQLSLLINITHDNTLLGPIQNLIKHKTSKIQILFFVLQLHIWVNILMSL